MKQLPIADAAIAGIARPGIAEAEGGRSVTPEASRGDKITFTKIKTIATGDPVSDGDAVPGWDKYGRQLPIPVEEFTIDWAHPPDELRRGLAGSILNMAAGASRSSLFLRFLPPERPLSRWQRWKLRLTLWRWTITDRLRYLVHGPREED